MWRMSSLHLRHLYCESCSFSTKTTLFWTNPRLWDSLLTVLLDVNRIFYHFFLKIDSKTNIKLHVFHSLRQIEFNSRDAVRFDVLGLNICLGLSRKVWTNSVPNENVTVPNLCMPKNSVFSQKHLRMLGVNVCLGLR